MEPARSGHPSLRPGGHSACLRINLQLLVLPFTNFIGVDRLRQLHVVTRAIIGSLSGVLHAHLRTAPVHLPPTFLALREMLVALRIGTIDHFIGSHTTIAAGRHYRRVDFIHFHGYPVVKHVALPIEVLTPYFLAVLDDAAM